MTNAYECPTCHKLFDMSDKLADFALAAHVKDHAPYSSSPKNLIKEDADGVWVCKLCGYPCGRSAGVACTAAISHAETMHPSRRTPKGQRRRDSDQESAFGIALTALVEGAAWGLKKVFDVLD